MDIYVTWYSAHECKQERVGEDLSGAISDEMTECVLCKRIEQCANRSKKSTDTLTGDRERAGG